MADDNRNLNPHCIPDGEFCRVIHYERYSSDPEARAVYDIIAVAQKKNQRREFMRVMRSTYDRMESGLICEFEVNGRLEY